MSNPHPKNRFTKGDPRINRAGRPKVFDQYRALVQEIMSEPALNKNGDLIRIQVPKVNPKTGEPVIDKNTGLVVLETRYATNVEMVLRGWLNDKHAQANMIDAAYGKPPMPTQSFDVTSGGTPLTWAQFVAQADDDSDTGSNTNPNTGSSPTQP